jgi:hypothetical protein
MSAHREAELEEAKLIREEVFARGAGAGSGSRARLAGLFSHLLLR